MLSASSRVQEPLGTLLGCASLDSILGTSALDFQSRSKAKAITEE